MDYQDLDVMVLTYNRSQYLEMALSAICESNATWRKIIILNNASTDNTLDVISEIQKKYPNRKIDVITHKKNLGNAGNFKVSQKFATNKYLAVFHDDDIVHPEYIDRAMQLMNKNIVMSTGMAHAVYNADNVNWDILPDTCFYYPKDRNAFLQMIIGRPTFCCAIYKTSIYRRVGYHPELYGKLHDIIFMYDVGRYGDLMFLHGECIRCRQHIGSDTNFLKTGPFPEEILAVLAHMKQDYAMECPVTGIKEEVRNILYDTLLFNFALFLYQWSAGERFMTWNQLKEEMLKKKIFNKRRYFLFDHLIDWVLNPAIRKIAEHCRKKYSFSYEYRVGK